MKTKISVAALVALVVAFFAASTFHRASGLYAQAAYKGATIVTDSFYNCEPGSPGCVAKVRTVHTFGPDGASSAFQRWLPAPEAASDPLMGTILAANGDSTHIRGNVGEYYTTSTKSTQPSRRRAEYQRGLPGSSGAAEHEDRHQRHSRV